MAGKRDFGEIERLPSKRYRARYMNGVERFSAPVTFTTKAEAEAWLAAERKLLERDASEPGTWLPPLVRIENAKRQAEEAERNRPPLFADYAESWLRERRVKGRPLAAETVRKHRTQLDLRLLPAFGSLRLDQITPQMVNTFFDDLIAAGHSEKVRRETYSTGSAILSTAVSAHGPLVGRVSRSPSGARGVDRPRSGTPSRPLRRSLNWPLGFRRRCGSWSCSPRGAGCGWGRSRRSAAPTWTWRRSRR